jgi:hypothetical protein
LKGKARLHDQSLVKVFIPSYISAVNTKTNKMAKLDLDYEEMVSVVNSRQRLVEK